MRVVGVHAFVLSLAFAVLLAKGSPLEPSHFENLLPLGKRNDPGISDALFKDMQRFARFSSAAYQPFCPRPAGQTLVQTFGNSGTSTQGLVARDDGRKQIVVAFRGTSDLIDLLTDVKFFLLPLKASGVSNVGSATAHSGFMDAYNSVADNVFRIVGAQAQAHPDYSIVVTGHSLGGALASIASLGLKGKFPSKSLSLYTFGQPRTGNGDYANLVETRVGLNNIFRSVHTFDGVPTLLLQALGYKHHGQEYWQFKEPASPQSVKKCQGSEDNSCSDSIFSTGINIAHPFYLGQAMVVDPTVCFQ
jgi:hypothetical protein